MPVSSDNRFMVLQLLADAGRISRDGLIDIMPYSHKHKSKVVRGLVNDNVIAEAGLGDGDKSYSLMAAGRKELQAYNPQRYTADWWELVKFLKKHPETSRLCGDVMAAMSLAGYAVNPADKPILPAAIPNYSQFNEQRLQALYRNEREHHYGEILPNKTKYTRRITAINCYYDRTQLKLSRDLTTDNGIKNARAAGVLFTPSHLFRVYHGENTNIKYFKSGEENFYTLIEEMFQGYKPPEKRAILFFGRGFIPAENLLESHFDKFVGKRGQGILLGPDNLGHPTFYLPMRSTSLELLNLMQYPDWHLSLLAFAAQLKFGIQSDKAAWSFILGDRQVFLVADLNLTHMASALKHLRENPHRKALFICLNWQMPFVDKMARVYSDENPLVTVDCLPPDFITNTAIALRSYWGGDAIV